MKEIIRELTKALPQLHTEAEQRLAKAVTEQLKESRFAWAAAYPISLVRSCSNIKSAADGEMLKSRGFFDSHGLSDKEYSLSSLKTMQDVAESSFQTIDLAVLDKEPTVEEFYFESKRPNDYWRRLTNVGHIRAMVGLQYAKGGDCRSDAIKSALQTSRNGQWPVESKLRDEMRSKKENALLRNKPFVWIVMQDELGTDEADHVGLMLKHYFGDNVVQGEGHMRFSIGYMDELDAVSLREFYKKA